MAEPRCKSHPTSYVLQEVGPYGTARLLRHVPPHTVPRRARLARSPHPAGGRKGVRTADWQPVEFSVAGDIVHLLGVRAGGVPLRNGTLTFVGCEKAPAGPRSWRFEVVAVCDCAYQQRLALKRWREGYGSCPRCR